MSFIIDVDKQYDNLRNSKAGVSLLISGTIYSARDAAHKRIAAMLSRGESIPVDFTNKIIYYMGPTPPREGSPIGSCGPTSSYRMDDYFEMTCKLGIAATLGKGERSPELTNFIRKYKVPYLITIGGAGAYLAGCVRSSKTVLFEDLGAEAVMELVVENFPVIVAIDHRGNSIFGG